MKKWSGLFAFLLTAACGGGSSGGSGGTAAPLSSAQKQELSQTLESAGRAQNAAISAGQRRRLSVEAPPVTLESEMASALVQGACQIDLQQPNGNSDQQNIDFILAVKGQQCPVEMNISLTMKSGAENFTGSSKAYYRVKNAEYAKLNDVIGFSLEGGFNINMSKNGTTQSISGQGNTTGTLHSQKYGMIPVTYTATINGSENGSNGSIRADMVWIINFPGFTAELRETVQGTKADGIAQAQYINGQEVSETEFDELLSKAGPLFDGRVKFQEGRF